jgi:hypothetical protein
MRNEIGRCASEKYSDAKVPPPTRGNDVPAAMAELDESIARLDSAMTNLWDRMHLVLRDDGVTNVPERLPAGGQCVLSAGVRSQAQRIDVCVGGINQLLSLLEI